MLTLSPSAGGPGFGYESSQTLYKELDLDLKGEVLEKGSHVSVNFLSPPALTTPRLTPPSFSATRSLNFSYIIPSSTATYQRCEFGRVRHYGTHASRSAPGRL